MSQESNRRSGNTRVQAGVARLTGHVGYILYPTYGDC